MRFTLQPVRVATTVGDEEGCLFFSESRLVAVLVRLSEQYEDLSGFWFLEHGFGSLDGPTQPTFPDIEAAQDWVHARLAQSRLSAAR